MALGTLERDVMDLLWSSPDGATAYDLQERLDARGGKPLAVTTVLTVLGRLEKKGMVLTDRSRRPHFYRSAGDRAAHVAELMHEALGEASDHREVLERFVSSVGPDDAKTLRRLLGS